MILGLFVTVATLNHDSLLKSLILVNYASFIIYN